MLSIQKLHASVEGVRVLKGLDLEIRPGEIHAVMGPNGAGKSTLAKILAGDPLYEVTEGSLLFEGKGILECEPEERALMGLFMSFQYPPEIAGVTNLQLLQLAYNARMKQLDKSLPSDAEFSALLHEKLELLKMEGSFVERGVNEGFSGGEKKRNEILQMAVFDPKLSILDETDSGLDIDALRIVASGVNQLMQPDKSLLLITHYQRLLDYVCPDYVHVMMDGKIIQTGDASLAKTLEKRGYDWLS